MPAPKGPGIADDASDYEDLAADAPSAVQPPARPPALPKRGASTARGIADDAALFQDLVAETTDKARTLDSDWLYKKDGHVFGPVKPKELLELLYAGDIDGDTPIAHGDGEYAPLSRYGVFRIHLPKVAAHQQELQEQRAIEANAAKARLRKRLTWVALAVVLGGASAWGLVSWVRYHKEEVARAEAKEKEAALMKELDRLMASVTIEPPLVELVEDLPKDASAQPAGRRAVARFSSGAQRAPGGGTGELTRSEIMTGIARVFPGLKRCIVEQIQRDSESVPEQILLSFTINNDGVPLDVSVDRALRGTPLSGCIIRQVGEVRFRRFKGEVQNVEYPISIGRRG